MGRSPEECNEAPRIIWRGSAGELRFPIPALYDFNVDEVWSTNTYLVLALSADYELGSHSEQLAFWNLHTGHVTVTPKIHWESEEWDRSVRKRHLGRISSMRGATVAEFKGGLAIRNKKECLQVWPADRGFAACEK